MKKLLLPLLCILGVVTLTACGEKGIVETVKQAFEYPYTVELSTLPAEVLEKPERVVSLSPSLTEMVYAMGLQDRLVGVSDYCDYPSEASSKQNCGTIQNPNLKAIKKLQPQVVLLSAPLLEKDLIEIQQMGALVVILPKAQTLENVYPIYDAVGCIFDGKSQGLKTAGAFYKPYQERLTLINTAVQAQTPQKGVFVAQTPNTVASPETFESALMAYLGITNSASASKSWHIEDTAELSPDVILYDEQTIDIEALREIDGYGDSPAMESDKLYEVDVEAISRQGARMFKQAINITDLVYPNLVIEEPEQKGKK